MKWIPVVGLLVPLGFLPAADTKKFTDWSPPENLEPVVDSATVDSCVATSKNGLSLIFSSTRQAPGTTNRDLFVSRRDSVEAPWGAPQPLLMLNTQLVTIAAAGPSANLEEVIAASSPTVLAANGIQSPGDRPTGLGDGAGSRAARVRPPAGYGDHDGDRHRVEGRREGGSPSRKR